MRITNHMLQQDLLRGMQTNLRQVALAQQRVSSGLRLTRASDDPAGAAAAMQTRGSLRALDQYRRNIDSATARVYAEEGVLDQLTTLLGRAKELGLSQGSDTASGASRLAAHAELKQLLEQAVQLGNTKLTGSYLFGGHQPGEPPIVVDEDTGRPAVSPDATGSVATEINRGEYLRPTHTAAEIFGGDDGGPGLLDALADLADALASGNGDRIRGALPDIDTAFDRVQLRLADTGARAARLQLTAANLDALDINLQIFRSDLEDVDLEKAVTELITRQTAYQAAMLATSRVIGMTLADYLR